jgi:hypothetical protein
MTPGLNTNRFGKTWSGKRCLAKTRAGGRCQKPAWRAAEGGRRCNLHGGLSLRGKAHGMYKTGQHTIEAVAERRLKADAGRRSMKRVKIAVRMARVAGLFEGQTPRSSPNTVKKFNALMAEYNSLLKPPPEAT